jgi:hypothetical protein
MDIGECSISSISKGNKLEFLFRAFPNIGEFKREEIDRFD